MNSSGRSRLGLLFLMAGCGSPQAMPPRDLVGLLATDQALALCGPRKGPFPCQVHDAEREYTISYDSSGRACAYRETRLIPLARWDSTYLAVLASFHQQLGASETGEGRIHQWTRPLFTAYLAADRPGDDSLAVGDSLATITAGYTIAKARRCRRP